PAARADRRALATPSPRQREPARVVARAPAVHAQPQARPPQRLEGLDLRMPVLQALGDAQRHGVPLERLRDPTNALLQAPRRQQGFHRPYPVATLLALERL